MDIKDKFVRLAMAMEPENLWCDGEATKAEVNRKIKQIKKEWALLEKNFGKRVSINDVWEWIFERS